MTRVIAGISSTHQWVRLLTGLVLAYATFQWSASTLGSDRGQAGLIVGAIVVGVTLGAERFWFAPTLRMSARAIGLGRPNLAGLVWSAGISAVLLLTVPLFAYATDADMTLEADSLWLLPGVFAQAGIAEETLFRGYLFGHLRRGRRFWSAAATSMVPFVVVHLLLFLTMPWPVALAALLLAVVLSFPLAHLYEIGGATIWPPALLHFVVQATAKSLVVPDENAFVFPIVWMAASAVVPLLVLLTSRPHMPDGDVPWTAAPAR